MDSTYLPAVEQRLVPQSAVGRRSRQRGLLRSPADGTRGFSIKATSRLASYGTGDGVTRVQAIDFALKSSSARISSLRSPISGARRATTSATKGTQDRGLRFRQSKAPRDNPESLPHQPETSRHAR